MRTIIFFTVSWGLAFFCNGQDKLLNENVLKFNQEEFSRKIMTEFSTSQTHFSVLQQNFTSEEYPAKIVQHFTSNKNFHQVNIREFNSQNNMFKFEINDKIKHRNLNFSVPDSLERKKILEMLLQKP